MTTPAPSPWDDQFFGELEQENYDDFFAADGAEATAKVGARALGKPVLKGRQSGGEATDIEAEYEASFASECGDRAGGHVAAGSTAGASFAMDDSDDEIDMSAVQSGYVQDCRPPELPAPPPDFGAEDMRLREALADFYLRHRADNISNINSITAQYRGRTAPQLWASLAVKYKLAVPDTVEILSGVLYMSSPFELGSAPAVAERAEVLEKELTALTAEVEGSSLSDPEDRAKLWEKSIERGADTCSDDALRMLCFRGLQERQEMRGQVWKILLGCLPIAQKAEWPSIEAEKRALYVARKSEVLGITSDYKLEIKAKGGQLMEAVEMLQQIQKDVDRTHHELEFFRRPSIRAALISILFVYAQLNPGVRYVQGMNELAAVVLYVLEAELPRLTPEHMEADAFLMFSLLMEEVKSGFTQALEASSNGQPTAVATVEKLLRSYDPELARHLQTVCCHTSIFTFRWCTLLFSQDVALVDVLRLWDSFIADPFRFEFVLHVCLGVLLACREELLAIHEEGALADAIRSAPRREGVDLLLRRSFAICALERRGSQLPLFPAKSAAQLVEDISGWAQSAAARTISSAWAQTAAAQAQDAAAQARSSAWMQTAAEKAQAIKAVMAQKVQENVDPSVKEKVGQASGNVKVVAQGGMEAMKAWFEQDSPVPAPLTQPETYKNAQTKVASLWQTVRATGAEAVSKTQQLVVQHGQRDDKDSGVAQPS